MFNFQVFYINLVLVIMICAVNLPCKVCSHVFTFHCSPKLGLPGKWRGNGDHLSLNLLHLCDYFYFLHIANGDSYSCPVLWLHIVLCSCQKAQMLVIVCLECGKLRNQFFSFTVQNDLSVEQHRVWCGKRAPEAFSTWENIHSIRCTPAHMTSHNIMIWHNVTSPDWCEILRT